MQRETHLWEAFLLQVGNDALTDKIRSPDDMEDLVVVLPHQRQFETILRWIDWDRSRFRVTIEYMDNLSFDASQVDGLIECLDDSVVAE